MFELIFDGSARNDIANAYLWYEKQQPNLGERFLKNLETSFEKIKKNPLAFPKITANHHQYSMNKFPYVILYEISKKTIFIDAVFHTSKDPDKKP